MRGYRFTCLPKRPSPVSSRKSGGLELAELTRDRSQLGLEFERTPFGRLEDRLIARGMRVRDNVLYLVFKLATRLAPTGAGSTAPTRHTCFWPEIASWMASFNSPNRHRRELPPDLNLAPGWLLR